MALAGGMTAVLLPLEVVSGALAAPAAPPLLEPDMPLEEPLVPEEFVVPLPVVEGLVAGGMADDDEDGEEDELGAVGVSLVFLLHPPSARAAVKARARAEADLSEDSYMSFPFESWNCKERPDTGLTEI